MKSPKSAKSKGVWGPFDIKNWKNTPTVGNKIATAEDVKSGVAAFYLAKVKPEPYKINLPALAEMKEKGGKRKMEKVVIIQAEETKNEGVVIGLRYLNGEYGVVMLDEIKLLEK